MIKNHFKIAFRNLWKNKGYSAINIFGLAIGLATCLLITLFVIDEFSYDKYNEKADRIYRVNTDIRINGTIFNDCVTPAPMAAVLMRDYPQIEKAVRISSGGNMLVKKGSETLTEPNSFFADPAIFDVFTMPMISGDPKTALNQPNTMVISESIAKKYFNSTDVVGKTLKVDNKTNYVITGVIKNTPAQSHLHFSFIKSMTSNGDNLSNFWLGNEFLTYVLVRPETDPKTLNRYLKEVAKKYYEPELRHFFHNSFHDLEKKGDHVKYATIPLTKIHLYSTLSNELEQSGNIQYIYAFMVIAVFILLIACVNFTNLSTARSAGRSKEVGVRKVLGSDKSTLIAQFLTESVLTSLLAMVIALVIAILFLPYFNLLAGKEAGLSIFSTVWTLPSLLFITVFMGILAGLYPAFFLSSFKPIEVLKGKLATGFKGSWLRNSLVVFQFSTVIILIIGTLVIYSQLDYIRSRNIGYNREQVLVLKNVYSLGNHAQTFKNEVLQIPGVIAGTRTGALPTSTSNEWEQNAFGKDALLNASESVIMADWSVDSDFISTLNIKMAKGRSFSAKMPTDSDAILINETAAALLGYNHPLQEKLYDKQNNILKTHPIIGVVKDFNTGSVRNKTVPVVLRLSKYGDRFAFRIKSNNMPQVIAQIEAKYHGVVKEMQGQPFIYSFMDEDFNHLYQSEQRTGKLFITFAFFAILIACLGLFGLITYAAEQRTKEIGIRKVLGATVANVTAMLSKDFIKLVFISIIIASPIAWFAMNKWLQSFAYRITISWWVFALAALIALVIALTTVSFQAVKAALANPVDSLRSE